MIKEMKTHAEMTVIGAMLEDQLARQDALAKLSASDFGMDSCARVFGAVKRLVSQRDGVDLLTVSEELRRKGELDAVGGVPWLMDCSMSVPRHCAIGSHIQRVLDASLGRRGYNLCHLTSGRLLDPIESPQSVLDELQRSLTMERPLDSLSADQSAPLALAYLEEGGGTVIPTGIPQLDTILRGGIRTKQLTVIGAQPSGGKSALCRQIERSAATSGIGVHAHSIEIPKEEWMLHHAFALADVHPWKIWDRERINPTEWSYVRGWLSKMASEWNHFIDDGASATIDSILAKSRLTAMRNGVKLYTIDYLQLLATDSKNRHQDISRAAVALKTFAKDNDVAVVVLSQLARRGDINHRPTVQDLKESGDIEAAANVVLLSYRPKDTNTDEYTGEDQIIIGKQRDGKVGTLDMFFDWKTLTFKGRNYATIN